jgi:TFIIF-interacting CTD phosphatase-like protein
MEIAECVVLKTSQKSYTSNKRKIQYLEGDKSSKQQRSDRVSDLDPEKKKLLVLDLNGLLFHKKPLVARPHLNEFLEFAFKYFDVMVWSSGMPHTVENMLNKFFGMYKEQLIAIWARDTFGLTDEQYNSKCLTIKDLSKVWAAFDGRYSARNTILVDDSPEKAQMQPNNLVCASTFDPSQVDDDNELKRIMDYLIGLMYRDDVTVYMKSTPY